jgi:hypothetical protein
LAIEDDLPTLEQAVNAARNTVTVAVEAARRTMADPSLQAVSTANAMIRDAAGHVATLKDMAFTSNSPEASQIASEQAQLLAQAVEMVNRATAQISPAPAAPIADDSESSGVDVDMERDIENAGSILKGLEQQSGAAGGDVDYNVDAGSVDDAERALALIKASTVKLRAMMLAMKVKDSANYKRKPKYVEARQKYEALTKKAEKLAADIGRFKSPVE